MKRKILIAAAAFTGISLVQTSHAMARVTVLSGNVGLEQNYDSNIFRGADKVEQWTTILTPLLTWSSEGEKDVISLTGSSDLEWNQRRDVREFEHNLALSGSRELFRGFTVSIGNDYTYSDNSARADLDPSVSLTDRFARSGDYTRQEVARILFPELTYTSSDYLLVLTELQQRYNEADTAAQREVDLYLSNSPDNARRRSWDNSLSFDAAYEFAQDSVLTFGYGYSMNDDRTAGITEYYEHSPHVGLSYRFNPQWQTSLSYGFTKTQYEDQDDQRSHDVALAADYTLSQADSLNFSYGYGSTLNEGGREDSLSQDGGFGWTHAFTIHTTLTTSINLTYLDREQSNDERGWDAGLDLSHALQRGSVSLGLTGDFAEDHDNGQWEKLRRSWAVDGSMSYELMQDLSGSMNASYEKRYTWLAATGKSSINDYTAGVSVTYSFLRWYTVSCSYDYSKIETQDSAVSDYEDHQIMLRLTAAQDLYHW